ncbi:MAG: hypothetical protein CMJ44_00670 [Pimelobacter sp.]|nr:hypothetical protein [Pimelobacter sp.]
MSKRTRPPGPATPPGPPQDTDDALLRRIRAAVPQPSRSDEDALFWLEHLGDASPLPPSLSDPAEVVARIFGGELPPIRDGQDRDDEHAHSLRRAARNGRAISDEVEDAMRRAREEAERGADRP